MQLGWGLFYFAVTALTLWIAPRGPERFYAGALFANTTLCNAIGEALTRDYRPGVNLLLEFALFELAAISTIAVSGRVAVFTALAFISVISLTVSTSAALSFWPFGNYEVTVNILLLAQCAIIGRRGIANVIGRIYGVGGSGGRLRHVMDGFLFRPYGLVAATDRASGRRDAAGSDET